MIPVGSRQCAAAAISSTPLGADLAGQPRCVPLADAVVVAEGGAG